MISKNFFKTVNKLDCHFSTTQ